MYMRGHARAAPQLQLALEVGERQPGGPYPPPVTSPISIQPRLLGPPPLIDSSVGRAMPARDEFVAPGRRAVPLHRDRLRAGRSCPGVIARKFATRGRVPQEDETHELGRLEQSQVLADSETQLPETLWSCSRASLIRRWWSVESTKTGTETRSSVRVPIDGMLAPYN